MDTFAYLEQFKKVDLPSRKMEINRIFNMEHWAEGIKQVVLWFLFKEILTFTVNNVYPQSEYLLLQSMFNVFYLLKVQVQFDEDELSEVWIICTCSNKFVHYHISEVKYEFTTNKEILTVLIKAVVFHHVSI